LARGPTKLEETKRSIEKAAPSAKLSVLTCDLGDLKSVQYCAEKFLEQKLNLHILINNAGIMAVPEHESTAQGLEQQVGVCHVGHFLLTKLLLPSLQAGAKASTKPSKIVCLSSLAHIGHEMGKLLENPKLETVPYIITRNGIFERTPTVFPGPCKGPGWTDGGILMITIRS
jgi:NAD(P)-dependent dehydrogenase (short-subunit alcohol dehydrogenase family)